MPHSTYLPELMGSAVVEPAGAFEAGSYQSFTLTYTAGTFGIDDTGSIKVVHRFASDMGRPQFDDPAAPNYVTVEASNKAVLDVRYDPKQNIRPWDKTLYIKVVRGFLREGDQIIVRFGDRRQGSPGIRLQTFCEHTFEFRVLVDPNVVHITLRLKKSLPAEAQRLVDLTHRLHALAAPPADCTPPPTLRPPHARADEVIRQPRELPSGPDPLYPSRNFH